MKCNSKNHQLLLLPLLLLGVFSGRVELAALVRLPHLKCLFICLL